MDLKSTRDGFGDELNNHVNNKKLFVINADLGSATRTDKFCKNGGQHIDVGICEANAIGVASGLSENGYRVIISSFAAFLTGRYDQIRCSLAFQKAPVILVGTHAGLAIGKDGITQMGIEDLNILRALPYIEFYQPATYNEARAITKYLIENNNSFAYLRLGRQPIKEFFTEQEMFHGIRKVYQGHKKIGIFNSGCLLNEAIEIGQTLNADVWNIAQLKPLNFQKEFDDYKHIFTIEDHSVIGGLGSIIAEKYGSTITTKFGIPENQIVSGGDPNDLWDFYNLTANKMLQKIGDIL